MKNGLNRILICLLSVLILTVCAAFGAPAEDKTPVFWQLTAVERSLSEDYN